MSVFNHIKKIFSNKDAVEKIIEQEQLKHSELPYFKGLDSYKLVKKLGEGAFSKVYEAIHTNIHQCVAIKIIKKSDLNQTQKASVLKEIQIMRTLNHPSIIKMHEFIETNEYYFLILEHMNGGEIFHQIVHLTYFSEDLARHCIKQIAEGIKYLHEERGIVHRDIKPENILFEQIPFIERTSTPPPVNFDDEPKVDEGEFIPGFGGGGIGKIKIADFGLSKIVWDKHTMTPCGTVGYTAPEIVRDQKYSKSVDMWALGCLLYTMLCGFPPFYDQSIPTLTKKVAKGQYTFLSPWWDPISVEAKHLVNHLLEVNPKKRYTIHQFLSHPWMAKQGSPVKINPSELFTTPSTTTTSVVEENVSITPSLPQNIPSSNKRISGYTSMKDALDVTFAVHRMGEERAQRKHQLFGFSSLLNLSDEEQEEIIKPEDEDDTSEEDSLDSITKSISSKLTVESPVIKKLASGLQVSDQRVNKKTFDLNMNNATLLGRRKHLQQFHS